MYNKDSENKGLISGLVQPPPKEEFCNDSFEPTNILILI